MPYRDKLLVFFFRGVWRMIALLFKRLFDDFAALLLYLLGWK